MAGITDLQRLIREMRPHLDEKEYVFCCIKKTQAGERITDTFATVMEEEGMTLILEKQRAQEAKFAYEGIFHKITLKVHSSLEAVGLTAAFATALAQHDISANVIAGFYHDHIFVPIAHSSQAMTILQAMTKSD